MWLGGLVPLGYDKTNAGLIINPGEAETVRSVFRSYLEVGCVRRLKDHVDKAGLQSKTRVLKDGRLVLGKPFSRGRLYHLLSNPIYIGKIQHKSVLYDGLHDAIIDEALWARVQDQLTSNAIDRRSGANVKNPSPLAGKVFDETGKPLTPNHSNKSGRRYRYYVSDIGVRLPAKELEQAVLAALQSDREVALHFQQTTSTAPTSAELFLTVTGVEIQTGTLKVLVQLNEPHSIIAPFSLRRRGVEKRIVLNGNSARSPDYTLIKRTLAAMNWSDDLKHGASVSEIATAQGVTPEYITHNLGLAFLSPKSLRTVMDGKQRSDISAYQLSKQQIPAAWDAQEPIFLA